MKNEFKDDLIVRCLTDKLLPFALVFGFYVILHGHLSPGGGFQGGVLVASSVLLIYLAYGRAGTDALHENGLHITEALASVLYVVLAVLGIIFGYYFCSNILAGTGSIGEIWSSGTIMLMNCTVGLKVLAGIASLLLVMLGILKFDGSGDGETEEGGGHS